MVVRVRPDVSGLDKEFDYSVPPHLLEGLSIGSLVRIELNHRNVGGWVTAIDVETPPGVAVRPITKVSSVGPTAECIELARWAARRWSGRLASILKTASPPRMIASLPRADRRHQMSSPEPPIAGRYRNDVRVVRLHPNADVVPFLLSLAERGNALIVGPRLGDARTLAGRLRRHGVAARVHPRDWAAAAGRGGMVLGARSAVWARVPELASIVVLDEHDETLQEERNPTWHARDVAIERAARSGIPCYLVSPVPSLVALQAATATVSTQSRSVERAGWPIIELVDRRDDEPGRSGLFSGRVADLVRARGRVLAVLNRKGRAIMLACSTCGELVKTEDGERLMVEVDGRLVAPSTGEERPVVCAVCGGTRLKRLRIGVSRAAEELAALAGEPVDEVTGAGPGNSPNDRSSSSARIVVGTEAALHQLAAVDTVVFLDFDQELLAPRYRAGEQAVALMILAARLVGDRGHGGRIIVQTRSPDHRVLQALLRADPDSRNRRRSRCAVVGPSPRRGRLARP